MKKIAEPLYSNNRVGGETEHCDAFVQILFQRVQDYVNVREDPYYKQVVLPDLANFGDPARSSMTVGRFERHV